MLGRGSRIPSPSIRSARERGSEERNERQAACVATFEWGRQRQERDEEGEKKKRGRKTERDRTDSVTQLGYAKAVQVK